MFSEYRIHPALLHLLYCLLCSAGEEVVRLQELEGNTVTIHTGLTGVQSDAHILWFYRSEKVEIRIVNSLIIRGEIITEYYTPVLKPVIRNQAEKHSASLRESCSPLCSVKNGKDVSLSWYEEKERISSISNSDSSERLYLPLNVTNPNNSTYTCVAANSVGTQTTQLNITNICIKAVYQYVKLNYTAVKSTSQYSEEDHKKGGVAEDRCTLVVYSAKRM
ncbi:hypothetical protein MHYP_G00243590 [Metynnis hypsauchen]